MDRMEQLKAMLSLCLIFGMAFCLGSGVGHTVRVRDQAVMARPAQKDWGLSFQEDNKPPVADENMEQLAQYDAFYAENTTEKVLYLTFDCGYENGNTPAILDALKKHHVPAAFFIVGNYLEKILPVLGIRIISINDGFDSINSSGFTGGMSVALKNMLNAMYSRDLSRKVRSAMKTHAKNGEYMPAFPKYGYIKDPEDKHHLVIDPEAAEIVKLIFTMAADGKTKGQIAKHLNETHVLTCREYMCRKGIKMHRENEKEKKLWSVTTISDMLKNEVYLGKIIWNKKRVARTGSNKLVSNDKEEWIVVENAHEPIISDELFQKANEKAFTNQKRVLTKRGVACPIFFCPTCGRRLGFTSRETGYRCMQAHISGLSGCAESKMDRKEAEETVLDAARNMAQLISENLEKKKSEWHKTILKEENIATLESEKKRLSSRKMKLYSDYRSEVLDKEGYMEELEKTTSRISEITLQIAELENEIAVAKKKCDEATEKEMEVNEIAALQDFDKIQLSKIIEKVFIYEPGRMEISWKMDDIFYKEEKA